jgi:4-carboxymuconolactone decarboxylase
MAKAPPSAQRDRLKGVAPRFVELTNDVLYGDVWERPGLSKRDRSLITIAALTAMSRPDQLKAHISRGLGHGLTKEELGEVIIHLAFYCGWPAATSAAMAAMDVIEGKADI